MTAALTLIRCLLRASNRAVFLTSALASSRIFEIFLSIHSELSWRPIVLVRVKDACPVAENLDSLIIMSVMLPSALLLNQTPSKPLFLGNLATCS